MKSAGRKQPSWPLRPPRRSVCGRSAVAANPDGITENTSKKKQERKEREEREAAQREFAARKAGIDPDAPKAVDPEKCPSGIPDRPYCRGRAYDPNRYKRNASDSDAAE